MTPLCSLLHSANGSAVRALTDGRYQVHYLPRFAVGKKCNIKGLRMKVTVPIKTLHKLNAEVVLTTSCFI